MNDGVPLRTSHKRSAALRFCLAVLIVVLATMVGTSARATGGEPDPSLVARAKAGDAEAAYRVGCLYDRGDGVEQDFENAAHWYGFAAKYDYVPALIDLGIMRLFGEGVSWDRKAAVQLFTKAAEIEAEAMRDAGSLDAGSRELAESMFILGTVLEDTVRLSKWERDSPEGRNLLKTALLWYQASAALGLAEAEDALAQLLLEGLVVERDAEQAWSLVAAAAEQGFPPAQASLGERYRYGMDDAPIDAQVAVRWYQKAAEQGYEFAQMELARMYLGGRGIARDAAAAAKWFERAAAWGNPEAEYELGKLYQSGDGVPKDEDEALYWIERAARTNHEPAVAERDRIAAKRPEQVVTAIRQRAREAHKHVWGINPAKDAALLGRDRALAFRWSIDRRGPRARLCGR